MSDDLYQICNKTVIDSTDPNVSFNSNGESNYYSYSSYQEAWHTTVYGSGLNRDEWTRYMLCPMKYNRLIIFRTYLWHSHNYNFGDSMENGRLVQLFFWNDAKCANDNHW